MPLSHARSLEERAQRIRQARLRGDNTRTEVIALLEGVTAALHREFGAGRLLFRLVMEDLVYDPELQRYAVAADVPRFPLGGPTPAVTLLDNGIYAPEVTGYLRRPLSARTMVHNLAALLYYGATGLNPAPGIWRAGAPDLPPVRIFEPDLPLGLDPLLRRALLPDPDDRIADPATFATELAELLARDAQRRQPTGHDRLALRFAAATHTGLRKAEKNPTNQDQHLCRHDPDRGVGLFVVADGVSKCEFGTGERAAFLTVQAAQSAWDELSAGPAGTPDTTRRSHRGWIPFLTRIFERANRQVAEEALARHGERLTPAARIMSSTVTALVIDRDRAIIANLGDSRAYLVREDLIDQLTVDLDRRTALLRKSGELGAIMNASGLGELTGNIGRLQAEPDGSLGPAPLEPQFSTLKLIPGDRLLVCSDGIPDCIGPKAEARMQTIINRAAHPAASAWELVVAANEQGGE